jgi:hypothetical protein
MRRDEQTVQQCGLARTQKATDDGERQGLLVDGQSNDPQETLTDSTFEKDITSDGNAATSADCIDPKAGYCLAWSDEADTDELALQWGFGWEASMTSVRITRRKDFTVFADKVIKCTVSTKATGASGAFEATRNDYSCD